MDRRPIPLQADDVAAINALAAYLALDSFAGNGPDARLAAQPADYVVLAGNSVLHTAEETFRFVSRDRSRKLLISGGIGHSTQLLRQAVQEHATYRAVATEGRPEAPILRDIARFWNIDPSRILVDDASTHCGENALFSRQVLEALGQAANTLLLVQDPTMQRRTDATFRHVWRDLKPTILNWPTFVPQVTLTGDGLRFCRPDIAGLWPMGRFLSLVLGEIPRLRDDPSGYGPRGRGFIAPVDIPDPIEAAYARLRDRLSGFDERVLASRPA